jgi:hypothetical protein
VAIASVGTLGTAGAFSNASSYSFSTGFNALAAGDFGLLVSVSDNTGTSDGDNNEHTSVSGGTGTWTKLGEYGNSSAGAAAGVVVSVWLFQATGTVSIGTSITLNFSSNRVDKSCSFWKFTKTASANIQLDTEPATNPITSEVNAANGFGSSAFSGLASAARLYFRGLGKEANSTTAITVSAGPFVAISPQRSRNNADAVLVRGEFRISTSTGETSNPTLAVSGDTAGLFFALVEVANTDGTLSQTLGDLTSSAAGTVDVAGASAVTLASIEISAAGTVESSGASGELAQTLAALTVSSAGTVDVAGAAALTLGALILSAAGVVADPAATLDATLDALTVTATGGVEVQGAASVSLAELGLSATAVALNADAMSLTSTARGSAVSSSRNAGAITSTSSSAGSYSPTSSAEGSRP